MKKEILVAISVAGVLFGLSVSLAAQDALPIGASCVSARSFSAWSWSRVFGFVIVIGLLF